MNNLKISFKKREPHERRNRKGLKGFAKVAKKNFFQTGVRGHKALRLLPFHSDPNINEIDVFATLRLPDFVLNEIEN